MTAHTFAHAVAESLTATVPESNYTSDCFVTSELAYNEVLTKYRPTVDTTAAYVGVGPCQNLTYVGALRPRLAVVVDARVDNLLEHLVFKLLIERANTPLEYLALLFARELPAREPRISDPGDLVAALEGAPISVEGYQRTLAWLKDEAAGRWPLRDEHRKRLDHLYAEFFRRQLGITSVSDRCLPNLNKIPTLREVLLARTSHGVNLHFLTRPDHFAYVRKLHAADRIIPLLGNLTSPETIARVNRLLRDTGEKVATLYVSNLEEFVLERYLIDGDRIAAEPNPQGLLTGAHRLAYDRFIDSIAGLDAEDGAVVIRFFFPGEHRGRAVGVFPNLEPDVRYLAGFVANYRSRHPETIFDTYF